MPATAELDVMASFNDRAKKAGWAFICGPARDFAHAELAGAHDVWREKAQGRAMPFRADLTARAMKPYLTHTSLLERVAVDGKPRYRIRLHGSALARYAGDSTGKFLEDAVSAQRLESFIVLYDMVLKLGLPVRIVSFYQAPEIDYLMGESLVAPLAMPGCETPLLLSVTYAKPRAELSRSPSLSANGFG